MSVRVLCIEVMAMWRGGTRRGEVGMRRGEEGVLRDQRQPVNITVLSFVRPRPQKTKSLFLCLSLSFSLPLFPLLILHEDTVPSLSSLLLLLLHVVLFLLCSAFQLDVLPHPYYPFLTFSL